MACGCCDPPQPCCGCWGYRTGSVLASIWTGIWSALLLAACIVTIALWPTTVLQVLLDWVFIAICIMLVISAVWLITAVILLVGVLTKVSCLFFPWLLMTVIACLMHFVVVFALLYPLSISWYVGIILAVVFGVVLGITIHSYVIVVSYMRSLDTGDEDLMAWHTWPRKKKKTIYTETLQRPADDKESIYAPSHYSYNTAGPTARMLEEVLYPPVNDPHAVYNLSIRPSHVMSPSKRDSREVIVGRNVVADSSSTMAASKRSPHHDVDLVRATSTSHVALYPAGSIAANLDRDQDREVLVARSVYDEPLSVPQTRVVSGMTSPSSAHSSQTRQSAERDEVFFPPGHDPQQTRF
ncbi:uncharacterized protein LOC106174734 isoform X1 [Lingula anatina]|uniref:Uncharacterized protein LOC106168576 n=1 Tax=Lingula anatina TaxID=7574 RepID=A0A1S3IYU5_LINAN|nr:uncharacterized protein LOC106168576 [Lingula anatina]XP_013411861.1 uncharacterized protein LOC106174734 isoform X1 [Lingula anatina]|eukprot:XP_013403156.1 uncharacterized protein LOC106168576 [Lingula anatina]